MDSLGFIEAPFLSISAMLAQAAANAADVRVLGFEVTGNENVLIRLAGNVSQVRAALDATDAMLKAADVKLVGKEKIGAAYVTVVICGDVAAVSASIEAGKQAVGALGKVIAAHVIARPHDELLALLPK